MMEYNRIDTVICFNKTDQVDSCILDKMIKDFRDAVQGLLRQALQRIRELMK